MLLQKVFVVNYGNFSIFNFLADLFGYYGAVMENLPAKMTFGGQ